MASKVHKKPKKSVTKIRGPKVAKQEIFKGLAGVTVDTTSVSKVMPETNSLTYRGYAVQDLSLIHI